MAIGISEEHRQLTDVAADLMKRAGDRQSARLALESEAEELPSFWADLRRSRVARAAPSGGIRRLRSRIRRARRSSSRSSLVTSPPALTCPASSRAPSSPTPPSAELKPSGCRALPTARVIAGVALDSELERP